jgi:hypothetical protein
MKINAATNEAIHIPNSFLFGRFTLKRKIEFIEGQEV